MQNLQQILQNTFWLENFREWQKEIIESVINKNDTLVFMPTWWWKSLTYQLPWIALDWLVLVVSPLISLMKDQVDSLKDLWIKAELLNSTTDTYDKQIILNDISRDDGTIKFLYIAPERLNNEEFLRVIKWVKVALIAIDEAHCISQWGHDFRPSYMKLKGFLKELNWDFPIIALTATATSKVRADIIERLGLENPKIFTKWFDRKNIIIIVREISKKEEKLEKLLEIIKKTAGSWIVYCSSRKVVKEVYEFLLTQNIKTWIYTWEMNAESREAEQNNFMNGEYKVIVATNAFGMGIDKKDIRFVVHFNLPGSIENYYQEVWRAGRDWKNSFWVVLASFWDTKIQEFFIDNSNPSKQDILKFYNYLYKDFKIWEWRWTQILKTYNTMAIESDIKNDLLVWAILRIFEKYGIVKRWVESLDFRGKWLELLQEKRRESHILIDWKHQELLKDEAYFKLDQIKKLLFYPSCRKKFILEYFWDEEDLKDLWENCGTCDFCLEKQKIWEAEDLVKISVFTLVLETVKKYDERFWVWMFVRLLYGSGDKKIIEWNLDNSNFFGALQDFTSDMIQAVIEALISLDFLYKTDGKFPLLWLTETWRIAIVRNYLLSNENDSLQHFIRMKIGNKAVFKKQKKNFGIAPSSASKKRSSDTYGESLQVLKEILKSDNTAKQVVKALALKRYLKPMTVENHIIKLYESGDLSLMEVLSFNNLANLKQVKETIKNALSWESEKLKPIKEKLEEAGRKDISYFEIKLAIAMMEKGDL